MGSMPMKKLLISMSLPIMLSMVVQALYNIVDGIFVAQIGEDALAAVSFAFPVQMIMIAVSVGTSVGINSLMSRYMGSQNADKANATAKNGLLLAVLSWLVFVVFGLFGARWFMSIFTDQENLMEMGIQYIVICSVFSIGVFVQIVFERFMQASGKPIYSMILQGVGAILNIMLDPILIFGWFGLPKMGVAGAAIATVVGQIVAMLIGLWLTIYKLPNIQIHFGGFRPDKKIIQKIYIVGIPAILIQGMTAIMTIGMNMILAPFSDLVVSVFGIYYKLQNFVFMAILGLTNALIPIIGYNYGAKNGDRVIQAIRLSVLLSSGMMLLGTIVFQIFPKQLLLLFDAQQDMLSVGIPALRIISLSFLFAGISMVLCSAFQAMGNGILSLIVTLVRQLILLLPLSWWLARTYGLPETWIAFLIVEVICMGLSFWMMRWIYRNQIQNIVERKKS